MASKKHDEPPLAPTNLQALEVTCSSVTIEWTHFGHVKNLFFLIEWSKDGKKFSPVNEIEAVTARSGSRSGNAATFRFTDPLPTSGSSLYRVRAFVTDAGGRSEPSNELLVCIAMPASGDV